MEATVRTHTHAACRTTRSPLRTCHKHTVLVWWRKTSTIQIPVKRRPRYTHTHTHTHPDTHTCAQGVEKHGGCSTYTHACAMQGNEQSAAHMPQAHRTGSVRKDQQSKNCEQTAARVYTDAAYMCTHTYVSIHVPSIALDCQNASQHPHFTTHASAARTSQAGSLLRALKKLARL